MVLIVTLLFIPLHRDTKEMSNNKNIKDMNGKIVNVSNGLKNKDYIISIEDNIFVINFYDYNI